MTTRAIAWVLAGTLAAGGAVAYGAMRHRCACGSKGAPERLSTPDATLWAALRARADGDLAALLALCSEAGRRQVAADLAAYSTVLAAPSTGPRAVARVPTPRTEAERDDLRAAIAGDAAAAFRVLARTAPLAVPAEAPQPAASSPAGTAPERVALEYTAPDGGRRVVSLAHEGETWRVDRFPL